MTKALPTRIALTACLLLCGAPPAGAAAGVGAARHDSASPQAAAPRARAQRRGRQRRLRRPDVIFVPTPPETVDEMLRQANLKKGDVLYDLGSGDGRIPLAAARKYGVRAVGIDIDPKLVAEANEAARREGLESLVSFRHADMFAADVSEATVVTLYLLQTQNEALLPKLRELKPGARVVAHHFPVPGLKPDRTVKVRSKETNEEHALYLYTAPFQGVP